MVIKDYLINIKEYTKLKINFLAASLMYSSLCIYFTCFLAIPAIFTPFNADDVKQIMSHTSLTLIITLVVFCTCWILYLITLSERNQVFCIWKQNMKILCSIEAVIGLIYAVAAIMKGAYFVIFAVLVLSMVPSIYTYILTFVRLCQFDLENVQGLDKIDIKNDGMYLKNVAAYKKNIVKNYPKANKYLVQIPQKQEVPPYKALATNKVIHIASAFIVEFVFFVLPEILGKACSNAPSIYIFGATFFATLFMLPKCNEYLSSIEAVWKVNGINTFLLIAIFAATCYASTHSVFYFFTLLLTSLWVDGIRCAITLIRLQQFDLDNLNRAKYISYSENEWKQAIKTEHPKAGRYLK